MTSIRPKSLRRACPTDVSASKARRQAARIGGACLLLASLTGAGIAQAQTTPAAGSAPAHSDALTWNGITLYGIVDVGLSYETHGAPSSDYFPAGIENIIQKNSNNSVTAVTPNNLSQSRIGLSGKEPIAGDWSGVFRVETYFNPQSGDLSDALKSLTQNNGRAAAAQTTNVDSSIAGQLFGVAYAGFSSPTVGTFTFGRQLTTLADGISKYDALYASNAFSLIGFSGTTAGGGVTEDRRLDQAVKYVGQYDWAHLGALYQFGGSSGSTNTAYQFSIGGEIAGFSADAYYAKKYNAVAASALSAAQVADFSAPVGAPGSVNGAGYTLSNSLSGTVSDNTTYGVMGSYGIEGWKFFGGYEHISFADPSNPYVAGQYIIGGYQLAFVNNQVGPKSTYANEKVLQVYWAGLRYAVTPQFELAASYYGYKQNSYATGADAGCSSASIAGSCSGTESAVGLLADYRFSKRFDGYIGGLWTSVSGGLANGYALNTSTISTTLGVRYKF
jgi:predicted porin